MDLKARCVVELYQAFKAHKGQLFEAKKHMPNVIKTIVKCYKGFLWYILPNQLLCVCKFLECMTFLELQRSSVRLNASHF
jgi:hypothetical protein